MWWPYLINSSSTKLVLNECWNRKCYWILFTIAAAAAKSLQSCPTLCDPVDSSPPGSPIPGIPQARTPEWVAISFSSAWKWKVKVKLFKGLRTMQPPAPACTLSSYWLLFLTETFFVGVCLCVCVCLCVSTSQSIYISFYQALLAR